MQLSNAVALTSECFAISCLAILPQAFEVFGRAEIHISHGIIGGFKALVLESHPRFFRHFHPMNRSLCGLQLA